MGAERFIRKPLCFRRLNNMSTTHPINWPLSTLMTADALRQGLCPKVAASRLAIRWFLRKIETAFPTSPNAKSANTALAALQPKLVMPLALILALTAAAAQTPTAASSKTLDQVIDSYTAAVGGKPALDDITSWEVIGRTLDSSKLNRVTVLSYWKPPTKSLQISKSTFSTSEAGYNGKQGWYLLQHGKSHRLSQEKLDLLLLTSNPLRFVHLKEIYPAATLEGESKLDGQPVDVVFTRTWEGERRLFFDAQSHLLIRLEDRLKSSDKPRLTRFSKYQSFGDIKLPSEISQDSPYGPEPTGVRIDKVHFNVTLKDIQFENPR